MSAREKTDWLIKTNPYKQRYLWDAWREGARAFWTGSIPAFNSFNSRERHAFWKGYNAAEGADDQNKISEFARSPGWVKEMRS